MPHIIAVLTIAGWIVLCGNAAYLLLTIASVLTHRSRFGRSRANAQTVPATVLKPLCGPEPGLEAALESFLSQETLAPVRFVLGAASATDRALPIARAVAARYPHQRVEIRGDPRRYGTNPKVDNLINMSQSGLDEIVVVSDSDIVIPPGSLQRLLDQFSGPGVGAVTTLYRGRPANSRSHFTLRS